MKATITNCLVLFVWIGFFIHPSFSQKQSYVPDELIVDVSNTSQLNKLRRFQEKIGALVVQKTAQLELWNIPTFPVYLDDRNTQPIYNVLDILNHTYGDKPGVNEFGLNYFLEGPATLPEVLEYFELGKYTPAPYCPSFNSGLPLAATTHVPRIAIIDSGVDHLSLHALFSQYTIELSQANNFVDTIDIIPIDKHGHGTQIMGAIMGTLTAWEVPSANFVPYKVIDRDGQGTLFSLLRAIYKTLSDGADVVNMSLGFYPDPQDSETVDLVEKAILSLAENDIITVLAAGNSSKSLDEISFFPATIQSNRSIVVAASECLDSLAKFSNYGAGTVHLAAPGTDILCPSLNSEWVLASGSSYSAAITTGFTAALFSLGDNPNSEVIHCSVVNGVTPSNYLTNTTISGGILSAEAVISLFNSGNCIPVSPPTIPQEQQLNQPNATIVYPNPTRGHSILRLEASREEAVQFNLFDLYGRRLQSFERALSKGINKIQLDLHDLSPGIYYLSSDEKKEIRIVKQ